MMQDSYRAKMAAAHRAAYLKRVVSQPTQQSNVKAVMDKSSPTKIREAKT